MKKALSILLMLTLAVGLLAGCGETPAPAAPAATEAAPAPAADSYKVALITMDSIDQHWITLKEGADKAAAEFGVDLTFMAPNTKDDAL